MARKRAAKEPEPADPLAWMSAEHRKEHEDELKRMVVKPAIMEDESGDFQITYWVETEPGKEEQMIWLPADADEERRIRAFYDAAYNLGAFAKAVPPGKPFHRSIDEWALIRAILADRAELTGYLVYADYLTECDDPQGELIRLAVETARLGKYHPRYLDAALARDDFACEHARHIYRGLDAMGMPPIFELTGNYEPLICLSEDAGVIERVAIDRPGLFPKHADRLFAAAPFLKELEFRRGQLEPEGLAATRQLAQIEELELTGTEVSTAGLATLLRSPHLTGLKILTLRGNNIGNAGAELLAAWPGLAKLKALNLQDCGIDETALSALVTSRRAENLTGLGIGGHPNHAAAIGAVLGSPQLKNLTQLEMTSMEFDRTTATRFHTAVFRSKLETLNLTSATFQSGAFEEFTRCKLPALRSLKLQYVDLRQPAAIQLADASFRETLEELNIDCCRLGPASAAFFDRAKFPKLRALDLSRNRIERPGLEALASGAKNFPALTNLRLWDNRLTPPAVAALADSKVLANVTHLELHENKIGPAGALALANSKYLTNLRELLVDEKTIGKTGKKALFDRFGERVVLPQ